MKKTMMLFAVVLFSSSVFAYTGGSNGNSATGPNVQCYLPDGTSDYMPIVLCQHQNGKTKY
ncbi:hypothetical protein [Vibrio campbellii]|uniref:hypothetical protein n=1 Tax=Vibrio campbellii TaxID=680 RepID=UPI0009BBA3FD|nr:hypothetical protein [Vibrio campbellii]